MKKRLLAPQAIPGWPWPKLPIIGIAGHARAGKNTIAQFIQEEYRATTYAFAEPLKDMLGVLGLDDQDLNGWRKDEDNYDYHTTPRHMMQTLGTEWGRDSINENIWVIVAAKRIQRLCHAQHDTTIIITDVRFENEADFVRRHGFLIHVERPDQRIDGSTHRSEHPVRINEADDSVIINDGDLEQLREEALRIAVEISNSAKRWMEGRHAS